MQRPLPRVRRPMAGLGAMFSELRHEVQGPIVDGSSALTANLAQAHTNSHEELGVRTLT